MNTIVHGICCFLITCSLAVAGDLATLRDAAGGKFLIGTIVNTGIADHPDQAALVASQFDAITAENQFKPAMLQPRRGVFDFSGADPIARFAAAHHQALIGHTLFVAQPGTTLDVSGRRRLATAARSGTGPSQESY